MNILKKNATNFIGILFVFLFSFSLPLLAQQPDYQTTGIKDYLPVFYQKLVDRQVYPLSWTQGNKGDFSVWHQEARAKVMECLLTPPFRRNWLNTSRQVNIFTF